MKSKYLLEILNYEQPVSALSAITSLDCSAEGNDPSDLCRDFWSWKSNIKTQIDIYFEISESDALDCFALLRTNLTVKAQLYLYGSNTSGIGGFSVPLFTRSLQRKNENWILLENSVLPACKYYKLSIVEDDSSPNDYVEIGKLLCGKTSEFPLEVVDGFVNGKESHQKRETQKGQWRPGSELPMLNTLEITFRPANGTRYNKNNEYDKIMTIEEFLTEVKTTRPFLWILNPSNPLDFFDYVTVDGDEIDIDYSDADLTTYNLTLKELK